MKKIIVSIIIIAALVGIYVIASPYLNKQVEAPAVTGEVEGIVSDEQALDMDLQGEPDLELEISNLESDEVKIDTEISNLENLAF